MEKQRLLELLKSEPSDIDAIGMILSNYTDYGHSEMGGMVSVKQFNKVAECLIEWCEGKADSTSEKDLRVCEVNGSYLDGLSSGIAACNAEFRVIMQNIYSELNNLPRINKSDMKRALYNHSSCDLGEALNPNMHEDSGE